MDNKYNLSNYWKIFSNSGNETLSISFYRSNPSFCIFAKNVKSRGPLFKTGINPTRRIFILDKIDMLMTSPAGTRVSCSFMERNKESRTTDLYGTMTLVKDERNIFSIEIVSPTFPNPIVFQLRAQANISSSGEAPSDEERSMLAMKYFRERIDSINTAAMLDTFNMETFQPGKSGGNRGGGNGGGYNRGGGYQNNSSNQNSSYGSDSEQFL